MIGVGPGGGIVRILRPPRFVRITCGLVINVASTKSKIVSSLTLHASMRPACGICTVVPGKNALLAPSSSNVNTIPHSPPSEANVFSRLPPVIAAN